ncbi:MAG: aminopeptidase P family protein [Butyribacter sp.]|nr:aminopeptidase P family protein [bacterium]MDY3854393.1 aminopeptidase P family protein [Butyribacter sp.]
MEIPMRLKKLRQKMEEAGIDIYFIPTNDYHGSEYVSDFFKTREYISGFDGSAGSVVVTQNEAGLWTDGRYFLQAEAQLSGTGITLYKSGQEGVPKVNDYIVQHLPEGGTFGCDGGMVSVAWAEGMQRSIAARQGKMDLSQDLVGSIWAERPVLDHKKAWILGEKYAGESRQSKIKKLRGCLEKWKADRMIITSLDDIAWILNIRGNDIPCNPVVLSYLIVEKGQCVLFAGEDIFTQEAQEQLKKDGISFAPYESVFSYVEQFQEKERILVDKRRINARIVENFPKNTKIVDMVTPTVAWKAIKNETEIANEKEAHIRDGVAVTKLIYWLKQNVTTMPLTEMKVAEQLEKFRQQGKHYLGPSFEPIVGYAEHGAIVHYSATEETDARLFPENFLLLDTGGQYLEGTTDITRTILLGNKPTAEQKKYYTAVLRGNLNLCAAKFLYGCTGVAIDYAARQPLWEMGCDFNHGTGHGVGYLLNVHEGPNNICYRIANGPDRNAVLEEGMITSDEPGIYLEGKFGIRLENLILCVKKEKNEFGQFMGFEPLTFVPFDRDAIAPEQMNEKERELLNAYHQKVYETLEAYLTKEEREWLADECAPV